MKKVMCLIPAVLFGVAITTAAGGLLTDGGFEESGGDLWSHYTSTNTISMDFDSTAQVHTGTQSLCVTWSEPVPQWSVAVAETDVSVTPGQMWNAEVYAKVTSELTGSRAYLETYFLDSNWNQVGLLQSAKLSGATQWTLLMNSGVVSNNAVRARLRLVVFASAGASSSGTIFFDDALVTIAEAGSSSAGMNLLMNSGLEAVGVASDNAFYWQWQCPSMSGSYWGNAMRKDWHAHSGSWCAAIAGSWAGNNDGGWWQEVPATSGVTYTFSGWFWADQSWTNQTDQGLSIEFYSGATRGETLVSQVTTNIQGISEDWTQRSLSGVCPTNATWARVVVWANNVGSDGALQCDDFSFVAEPGTVILISDHQSNRPSGAFLLIPLVGLCLRKRRKEAAKIETI